jgi:hypothetical protein
MFFYVVRQRSQNSLGEFGVCSGSAVAFESVVRQFRECKIMSFIGAFSESRPPGMWTRWN